MKTHIEIALHQVKTHGKTVLVPTRWFTDMTGPEQDMIYEILRDEGVAAIEVNKGKAMMLVKATVMHDGRW